MVATDTVVPVQKNASQPCGSRTRNMQMPPAADCQVARKLLTTGRP
jgi:hypothetical protein